MMKSLDVLQPCGDKRSSSSQDNDDRLSKLPNEIQLSMMNSFSMKEAAVLGLVSRQWEFIWRSFPVLIFENPRAIEHLEAVFRGNSSDRFARWVDRIFKEVGKARSLFAGWVDRVLEQHLGDVIDELRITFDFDQNWQCHVDKWVAIALDKRVKRLELDFSSTWRSIIVRRNGERLCGNPLDLPPNLTSIYSSVRSLCLKYVNATDEFVDCLPRSCPFLESLCIVGSERLTNVSGLLEQVKHLKVSSCCNLKTIDISAPQLRSFIHYNREIERLHIAHASCLSEVSIGNTYFSYSIAYVFDSLSEYFSNLVSLTLKMTVRDGGLTGVVPLNLVLDNSPSLPNLQHLEFRVSGGRYGEDLRGWASLIAAAPNLHKLTLKQLRTRFEKGDWRTSRWDGFPLKCLKTLELVGYVGQPIDLALAFFVFENAPILEEVIVELDARLRERLVLLETELPQGVKLTIK